jgi:hypothetical protein
MIATMSFLVGCVLGALFLFFFFQQQQTKLRTDREKLLRDQSSLDSLKAELAARERKLGEARARVTAEAEALRSHAVTLEELKNENAILKRDLRNIDVALHKTVLDGETERERHDQLDRRIRSVGNRHLQDSVKWISSSLTANNYVACKDRLAGVIERCRTIDLTISEDQEKQLYADLRDEYEKIVRAALTREEQNRIKARMREEQLLEREIQRELNQVERERLAIQAALDKALAEARDEHAEQVQLLRERLAEAEERGRRAMSRAQMTKAGHVYVISNIGSFGDRMYKIGMTRRLEPLDRIRELGDASVPFPFDVHMMISSDDAPRLENALHHAFHRLRVNRVNMRKEFFAVPLDDIVEVVKQEHGDVEYVADPEALEYRQSQMTSDEDEEFIERLFHEESSDDEEAPESDNSPA